MQQYATTFRDGGANAGEGYVIAAGETQAKETDKKLFALQARDYRWRGRVAVRPVGMALAGDKLLVAGPPDRRTARIRLTRWRRSTGVKAAHCWCCRQRMGRC